MADASGQGDNNVVLQHIAALQEQQQQQQQQFQQIQQQQQQQYQQIQQLMQLLLRHQQQQQPVQQQQPAQQAQPVAPIAAPAVRLQPFDGQKPELLDNWLFKLERYSNSDDTRINAAVALLDGPALQWWRLKSGNDNNNITWQEFKQAITARFGRLFTEQHALAQLDRLQQTGSLRDYTAQFENLCAHVNQTENDKRFRFIKGLRARLRRELVARNVPTFEEAVVTALHLEQADGLASTTTTPAPATSSSASSGNMEVDAAEEDIEIDYVRNAPSRQRPNQRSSFAASNTRNGGAPRTYATAPAAPQHNNCYNCHQPGHFAYECSHRCTLCANEDNHARRNCPHAIRRNGNNRNSSSNSMAPQRRVGNASAQ